MKGRILAGKYRLVHELGRGGMGSVWRADHIELRSVVAVKLIDPALAQSAEGRSRFLREARAAGALRSNHVVQVYDYGVDADIPYLVMELLEGESLASRLERKTTLTLAEMQPVIRQVGRALAKAHAAGIVHRDLKPENIFICSEGDSELVKVLDFGIAKVESNIAVSVQTQTGLVLGTPYYMSPEQAEGRKALDSRSDLWSLGVITFECLLGRRPFDGENLAQLILAICAQDPPLPSSITNVPAGFDEWFLKAVARRVELRFANIQELVDGFSALVERQNGDPNFGISAAEVPERLSAPSAGFLKDASGMVGNTALAPVISASNTAEATEEPATHAAVSPPETPVAALSQTEPRRHERRAPLALIVMVGALLLAVGSLVAWRSGRTDSSAATTSAASSLSSPTLTTDLAAVENAASVEPNNDEHAASAKAHDSDEPGASGAAAGSATAGTVGIRAGTAASITSTSSSPREVVAVSIPTSSPARAPTTTTSQKADKAPVPSSLYCVVNAISGRLQRASSGVSGSFPCYVNTISGQLKRRN